MKAILIPRFGGPEVLNYTEIPTPELDPNSPDALVKLDAIGVNFIDIYHRTGLYPNRLPLIPGMEGAGIVVAVGSAAKGVSVGDRVAYAMSIGSYAEYVRVPAWQLVALPTALSFAQGASAMLQGMTADYLIHGAFHLQKGQTALIHAAAGGTGLLFIQMAKRIGARVIGTVSTKEKAQLAREAGADEVILYSSQDFEVEVAALTAGKLCDVVYDSVGKDTFEKSLRCLKPRGCLVSFGQSSGAVVSVDIASLAKGSFYLTRPSLREYVSTPAELKERASRVFEQIATGVKLRIEKTFALSEAADAHRLLESRNMTGKLVLLP